MRLCVSYYTGHFISRIANLVNLVGRDVLATYHIPKAATTGTPTPLMNLARSR